MKKRFHIAATAIFLLGCVRPPQVYNFQKTYDFGNNKDEVWPAIVQLIAERGWSIQTIEKDSGIIVTQWHNIGPEAEGLLQCDCGFQGAGMQQQNRLLMFNIFLREKEDGGCDVTINTQFQVNVYDGFNRVNTVVPCNSTGAVEAQLARDIAERI